MPKLLVPTDYVDHEVAKLRREVIEWKNQVKNELQELRRSVSETSDIWDLRSLKQMPSLVAASQVCLLTLVPLTVLCRAPRQFQMNVFAWEIHQAL